VGVRDTVILIVSNVQDATADFFEKQLAVRGIAYVRLDTDDLRARQIDFAISGTSTTAHLQLSGQVVSLSDVESIYYRRPRAPELADVEDFGVRMWMQNEFRRAWGGILNSARQIRWVNHPLAISAASYKPEQLARAARAGLAVPETVITNDPTTALKFCRRMEWNVVVKPIGHGEIRGDIPETDRLVYTNRFGEAEAGLLERIAECPTLLQAHLTKTCDVRVTVVDDSCLAVALHSQERLVSRVDCRRENMSGMRYSPLELPDRLAAQLVALARSYELRFAAIDLVLDRDGTFWFLEINPAGQWAWLEQEIGVPISAALIRCLLGQQGPPS
jgi:glutathione synthase/RimK-type ligase-like ATP-grasp enzyme